MAILSNEENQRIGNIIAGGIAAKFNAGQTGIGGIDYGNGLNKTGYVRPTATQIAGKYANAPSNFGKFTEWIGNVGKTVGNLATTSVKEVAKGAIGSVRNVGMVGYQAMETNPLTAPTIKAVEKAQDFLQKDQYEKAYKDYYAGNISKDDLNNIMKDASSFQKGLMNVEQFRERELLGEGRSTKERIVNEIDGILTAATLGSGGAAKGLILGGGKGVAAKVAGRKMILEGLDDSARSFLAIKKTGADRAEDIISAVWNATQKIPGWREFTAREMARTGSSYTAKRLLANAAIETAVMSPLRRENIRLMIDTGTALREGNWLKNGDKLGAIPNALMIGLMAAGGGPVRLFNKSLGGTGKALKTAMYGESSILYWDEWAKLKGTTISKIIKDFRSTGTKQENAVLEDFLKSRQMQNLRGNSARSAAETVHEYQVGMGLTDGVEAMRNDIKHYIAETRLDPYRKMLERDGKTLVTARFDRKVQEDLIAGFTKTAKSLKGKSIAEVRQAAKDYIAQAARKDGAYWGQNQQVIDLINKNIDEAKNIKGIQFAIKSPATWDPLSGTSSKVSSIIAKNREDGFITVVGDSDKIRRPFVSAEQAKGEVLKSAYVPIDDAIFEQAAVSKPFFREMGSILNATGMGLEDTTRTAYKQFKDNLVSKVTASLPGKKAKNVIEALQQYTETEHGLRNFRRRTATDVRMMTITEVQRATEAAGIKLTRQEARQVMRDVMAAHLEVPIRLQGIANKVIAELYRIPGYKFYPRAQGAFRYTYNLFFRLQEHVETEMLGQAGVKGKQPWVWGMGKLNPNRAAKLDGMVAEMEKHGILDSTQFGEAAQDVFLGRVTANITHTQKRSLATVVEKMARNYGYGDDVGTFLTNHAQDAADMIRPIVQYPDKGFFGTNMAKALNLAIFPARYNLKVMSLATKALGQLDPMQQMLFINKLWDVKSWLDTPQGVAWKQDNADAIALFKWITPVGSVQWVFDVLGMPFGKSSNGIGDIGAVGGLPIGVLTQILDSQGLININTPYVSPKTGDIYSKKIPESMKARMASALTDLLGSTFTYPGRVLGLPGKGQLTREVASTAVPTKTGEWNTREYTPEDLSPQAQKFQQMYKERDTANEPKSTINPQVVPPLGKLTPLKEASKVPTYSKAEITAMKRQATAAKAASKKKKSKTTTFPTNLPKR